MQTTETEGTASRSGPRRGVVLLACDDRPGLVAEIATGVTQAGANIVDAAQHADEASGRFFQRVVFDVPTTHPGPEAVAAALGPVAGRLDMSVTFHDLTRPTKVAILASRERHCTLDLLHRWQSGELGMEPVAVISNHADVGEVADWFGVPFHHLPIGDGGKAAQEAQIESVLAGVEADLVVLARYMQVLSDGFCTRWWGRCINIHHSFLPAFAGASPYQQAFDRGVKLIGATAHYVTAELDEGPIIAQDVTRVSHRDDAATLARRGRAVESSVLAEAVAAHLDRRVVVHGRRTIVFP